ncbi:unnamed protein product (mitochondrion) [Plasmodiophora brassicae]|uniref:Uncharacterized protein n=1 Tax=Plasmodiophora brassicae TaxID=37360 RepID=A0A0G4J5E9_PLABS|nr:hypothetical protein PBRA_002694 [Plasmodiophora brassicae]SPQ94850.1 unnamed protein product [Plasmodiophora brassicae]
MNERADRAGDPLHRVQVRVGQMILTKFQDGTLSDDDMRHLEELRSEAQKRIVKYAFMGALAGALSSVLVARSRGRYGIILGSIGSVLGAQYGWGKSTEPTLQSMLELKTPLGSDTYWPDSPLLEKVKRGDWSERNAMLPDDGDVVLEPPPDDFKDDASEELHERPAPKTNAARRVRFKDERDGSQSVGSAPGRGSRRPRREVTDEGGDTLLDKVDTKKDARRVERNQWGDVVDDE